MKLYSGPLSLFTAKVRVALAEKQLDYERVEVGWSLSDRYIPHHPDVVAHNPRCEVPVLVDGDAVVYDSTLIFEYLEDRYPQTPLYPADAAGRAACRRLEADADEVMFPFVWDLIEETLYPATGGERDADRLAAARDGLAACYRNLDTSLCDREYLCGEFSVADIGTFIHANAATSLGCPPHDGFANLAAWQQRTAARPSIATETREMQEYLAKALGASS